MADDGSGHHLMCVGLYFALTVSRVGLRNNKEKQTACTTSFWLPNPSTSDSNQTFTQMCWSTQIFQTMAMVSQVAFYWRGAGQGENNLGALVWQLNDIWQGVSWSSIEHSGDGS